MTKIFQFKTSKHCKPCISTFSKKNILGHGTTCSKRLGLGHRARRPRGARPPHPRAGRLPLARVAGPLGVGGLVGLGVGVHARGRQTSPCVM